MKREKIHLLCNAHLDPVWLWQWEEGAAAALSTFRSAADLCEEFPGFVFNHNEAILYEWVEEYEPELFKRIQKLVRQKKWHIMGGWFLQPDCNMPSGESFVRQIIYGRRYFKEKFGAIPTTALNLDSFGHSRGLVQILAKSGYDSYLFYRPQQKFCRLPADDFIWVGFEGSEIAAKRASEVVSSSGGARKQVEKWLQEHPNRNPGLILWGVGDHGGGPSRIDLKDLSRLISKTNNLEIVHSTPEAYFKELRRQKRNLPRHSNGMNPWAPGCYTSMLRIKQKHRLLENEIYCLEKMASTAALNGLMEYPKEEIRQALRDLLFSEFHDILPGTSIAPVEEAALRLMDHGLEIVSRLKARSFFVLARGQPRAKKGEIPILVFNPHPYKTKMIVECEFQLAEQNWTDQFTSATVYQNGKRIPSQLEKEWSNVPIDWRKRIVFAAELEPNRMSRFDVRLETVKRRPKIKLKEKNGLLRFKTKELDVIINVRTGLMDRYRINGVDFVKAGAFRCLAMVDNEDPWGERISSFRRVAGRFRLMPKKEGSRFSGLAGAGIPSVRVIEDGEVRSVIEAVFSCCDSFICQRYKLPKRGTEIEVEVRVHWNEKNRMLKLTVPTVAADARFFGQTAYGVNELPANGDEAVAQKWIALLSKKSDTAFTCINDGVYGCDSRRGDLRISLLRSPAYSAAFLEDKIPLPDDRYSPRIDQGERVFRFWFNGGRSAERMTKVDREALVKNEKPVALSFFPSGAGKKPEPLAILTDDAVQIAAMKKAEDGNDLIIRLFEPTGRKRSTRLLIPPARIKRKITLSGFEIRTLKINLKKRKVIDVDLLERPLKERR